MVDVLVGQPRAGDRARRAAARHPARHRDAGRCAGGQTCARPRHTAARSSSTIAIARTAKRSAAASPANAALTLIPPYDHPHIIAGPGHGGARALRRGRRPLDYLLVPVRRRRTARWHRRSPPARCRRSAESSASNRPPETMRRGRSERRRCRRVSNPQTVADGARTPSLGSADVPARAGPCQRHDDRRRPDAAPRDVLSLGAPQTGGRADRRARRRRGAAGGFPLAGKRVGVILSGGNVELSQVGKWLAAR